jgi:2-C-methyl-D-erythritol 4-phosphate cytidylyltransferase
LGEPVEGIGAVVVAAGSGTRFGGTGGPRKQYRELAGRPLLAWSLRTLLDHPAIAMVVAVLPPDDVDAPPEWLGDLPVLRVPGGEQRGDSVRNGLDALDPALGTVLIHDGARPLLSRELLDRILVAARGGAVVPGLRLTDTLKEVGEDGHIVRTLDRARFWTVQTPQAFPAAVLRQVHRRARDEGISGTDDAALLERYGHPVRIVEGEATNLKVTTQADLAAAELLAQRILTPR